MKNTFVFQGKEYNSNQGWGEFHPKYNYWYDPNCINITKSDIAVLDISDTKKHGKNFGAGQLASVDKYLYGTFEFTYLLPKGRHLWPALWLTGVNSWPPEIDIMEGWTSKGFIYSNRRDYRRLFSNIIIPGIFYKPEEEILRIGIKSTCCSLQSTNNINTCKLEWYPDIIRVSYNNKEVFKIEDKEILQYFNKPMTVVINNAVLDEFTQKDYEDYKIKGRPFTILDFTYTEYKD